MRPIADRGIARVVDRSYDGHVSSDTKKLLEEAPRLPGGERLRLAERLLATCDGDPDPEAAQAWEDEIARRSRAIERGLVEPIPWSDVKDAARRSRGAR